MSNNQKCFGCGKEYKNLRSHYYKNPEHRPKHWDTCNQCEQRYKKIGQHWGNTNCSKPEISGKQHEIITGMLMGDASMLYHHDNPSLEISVIKKKYLDYIHEKFGKLSLGVTKRIDAENSARKNRETGFSPNAEKENYSDIYRLRLMAHEELKEYADWYSTGKKVFPKSIELTPKTLKHWYCCDGTMETSYGNKRIRIAASNELDNKEKIKSYFNSMGLPEPTLTCYESGSEKYEHTKLQIGFTVNQSKELFDYMGEPLPGFEYKWPERFDE